MFSKFGFQSIILTGPQYKRDFCLIFKNKFFGMENLRSDFHFDIDYVNGEVPLSENHLIADYERRRHEIADRAGAGVLKV